MQFSIGVTGIFYWCAQAIQSLPRGLVRGRMTSNIQMITMLKNLN